eukprot:6068527-Pleurochrysis_carterae.AAC.2
MPYKCAPAIFLTRRQKALQHQANPKKPPAMRSNPMSNSLQLNAPLTPRQSDGSRRLHPTARKERPWIDSASVQRTTAPSSARSERQALPFLFSDSTSSPFAATLHTPADAKGGEEGQRSRSETLQRRVLRKSSRQAAVTHANRLFVAVTAAT